MPPPSWTCLSACTPAYRDPLDWFRAGRAFVTCEVDEDPPYFLRHLGEDSIMIASDYPHGDPSADWTFVDLLRARTDVSEQAKEKMLGVNAARLFGW